MRELFFLTIYYIFKKNIMQYKDNQIEYFIKQSDIFFFIDVTKFEFYGCILGNDKVYVKSTIIFFFHYIKCFSS